MTFYLQSLYQEALGSTIDFMPQFVGGIFIFLLFYLGYAIVGELFDKLLAKKDSGRRNIIIILRRVTRIALITLGVITTLGTWGINTSAIVASVGIAGFALSFALKDALSSIFAGILLLIYKPFGINDTINVSGVEGKVLSIDMRYTILESKGAKHFIPNSILLAERVTVLGGGNS